MKDYLKDFVFLGLAVALGITLGSLASSSLRLVSQTGGDFAGGVLPSQLLSASVANGGITPVGNLSFGFGSTAPANQVVTLFTATSTYPTSTIVLGNITQTSSSATSSISFTAPGFTVGDTCSVAYAGAPTSTQFGADGFITAVSGNTNTSTITIWNGNSANLTLNSSTLKVTCIHTGV